MSVGQLPGLRKPDYENGGSDSLIENQISSIDYEKGSLEQIMTIKK